MLHLRHSKTMKTIMTYRFHRIVLFSLFTYHCSQQARTQGAFRCDVKNGVDVICLGRILHSLKVKKLFGNKSKWAYT